MPSHHVCPSCSSTAIHRSTRMPVSVWSIAKMLFRRPAYRVYRCEDCSTKFWDRPLVAVVETRTGKARPADGAGDASGDAGGLVGLKRITR